MSQRGTTLKAPIELQLSVIVNLMSTKDSPFAIWQITFRKSLLCSESSGLTHSVWLMAIQMDDRNALRRTFVSV